MATLGTNSTAGTLTASSTEDTATVSVVQNGTVYVKNASDSAVNALVNMSGVHSDGDFAVLEPGDLRAYRMGTAFTSSATLTFKTASGSATLYVDVAKP